jgi:hypothetical protein
MSNDFTVPSGLSGLGNPLQVHPPRAGAGRAGYFTIAAVLLILSVGPVVGILNPPQNNPPPQIVFFILMGLFIALAVVSFGVGLYSQTYTLTLYPDALAKSGKEELEIFRWSDIRDVYMYIHPIAGKHRLVTTDGRELQIDSSVKDGKKLGEAVQQALFHHMMPIALKAFENGNTLTFGPLRIDQGFLYYKDKRLAWYEVAKMQLLYNAYTRSVQFEVKTRGGALPWCSVKVQDVPNVDVFKALAEQKQAFTR